MEADKSYSRFSRKISCGTQTSYFGYHEEEHSFPPGSTFPVSSSTVKHPIHATSAPSCPRPQYPPTTGPHFNYNPPLTQNRCNEICGKLVITALGFSRRSTVHGVNHFGQARGGRRKLFWFIISVSAALGCFINLGRLFDKFISRPVLTNVLHDAMEFSFPDITVCLTNPIYFPPQNTTEYAHLTQLIERYQHDRVHHNNSVIRKMGLADYLYFKRSRSYSHPAWSAIVYCKYQQLDCNWTHFEVRSIWPYGNCFTFNATVMRMSRSVERKITLSPFRPDFKLVFYKAQTFSEEHSIDPHNSIILPSGALVMLHEANTMANIGKSYLVDGSTQVDLKITKISHFSEIRNCQDHYEQRSFVNVLDGKEVLYTMQQHDCHYRQMQQDLLETCNCVRYNLPLPGELKNAPLCMSALNESEMAKCYFRFMKVNELRNGSEECFRDFCEHFSYSTVVSQSKFPAVAERNTHMAWLNILKNIERNEVKHFGRSDLMRYALLRDKNVNQLNVTQARFYNRSDLVNEDFLEKNFMMLRIVPSSLYMDFVEEVEEYPLSRLLSDIGGCIGLYAGASLITIFEFIDLLCDISDPSLYRPRSSPQGANQQQNSKKGSKDKGNDYNWSKNSTENRTNANFLPVSDSPGLNSIKCKEKRRAYDCNIDAMEDMLMSLAPNLSNMMEDMDGNAWASQSPECLNMDQLEDLAVDPSDWGGVQPECEQTNINLAQTFVSQLPPRYDGNQTYSFPANPTMNPSQLSQTSSVPHSITTDLVTLV